jgi:hypothetical protein
MTNTHPSPPDPSPFQAEALALARANQKPGQTKEQTRLIAQGIAKGIEQYKRQQSAKARERDKSRKRLEKLKQAKPGTPSQPLDETCRDHESRIRSGNLPSLLCGGVFGFMSLALALLLLKGWSMAIAGWSVPSWLLAGWMLTLAGLAAWLISHERRTH